MFYKNNSFTKQMKKCLFNMIGLTEELELKVDFPLLHMDRKKEKRVQHSIAFVLNIQESRIYI